MTDNHLLLFRIAELMLEYEQHVLPVDLIFDDVQIGDYVKSIQIDSPYQQMLREGVLTESVRNEKLYVSYTVEGYFHYVLGEVIFKQTKDREAQPLKKIVEENKLNGAKEGVEQCLIRDVNQNELARLMWLIDLGGDLMDLCGKPLAHAFLNIKGKLTSEFEQNHAYSEQIKKVTNELFDEPTDNDIEALSRGIAYLEETQKNNVKTLLYQRIYELIVPNNFKKSILYAKSIEYIPYVNRNDKLQDLAVNSIKEESELAFSFYFSLGEQFFFVRNYDKAIECFEKSLSISIKINGDQHSLTSESFNNLGLMWATKREYDKALKYYEKSLVIRLKVFGDQHSSTGESYNNLGTVWKFKGEYDKSIAYFEKSLTIKLKIHGDQHPSTGISYNNLGIVWSDKGKYDKAIEYYEKSLSIRLKIYGDFHSTTRLTYLSLGTAWKNKAEFDKSIAYYEKSLEIDLKIHGDQHPSTGTTYNNLGLVWTKKGDYGKAISCHEKSLAIRLKAYGEQHPSTKLSLNNLGAVYFKNGEYDNAIAFYEKSLAIDLKLQGNLHTSTAISYTYLGNVYNKKMEFLQAKEYYSKAYTIYIELLGKDDAQTQLILQKLNDLK